MSEELRIDIWHWYSIDQALAAVLFSRLCGELEQSPPSPSAEEKKSGLTYTEEGRRRHRAYAIASVLASVAFLEACINELFASAEYEIWKLEEICRKRSVNFWFIWHLTWALVQRSNAIKLR